MKGIVGNPCVMKNDITSLKDQMQDIRRDFEQLSKTSRGERTLVQHIDKLSEVISNVEEVKNLMKRVPPLEVKNKDNEQMLKEM